MEQESADKSKASENEKRHRELQLGKQETEDKKRTMDIVSDMTRQFKSMQEELSNKINKLETLVSDNDDSIKNLKEDHEKLNIEKMDIEN